MTKRWLISALGLALAVGLTVGGGRDLPRAEAEGSGWATIKVEKGDTVYSIARRFGTDVETVSRMNRLKDPSLIRVGQVLRVPDRKREAESGRKGEARPALLPADYGRDLGEFTLTAYTAGPESTGKSPGHPAYGITSSGAPAVEGVTIAVDPSVIPIGSRVYIEGLGYFVAQDTGSAIKGKRIDVFMNDLEEALQFGVKKGVRVAIVE
ncbi:3D (Asp-Asp-Asp) domain-containing protein [Planifilum fulgidum]|jgi:3D (Asp-Asp-Asp) domain-containing protein|uniref:3D (Asp-Asp-Asp) domain-containing protein n=1 Tax=Planifilum fulgidum TaxID=201973 RepID=A0A1I2QNX0_9BACL|nr:3D domain-containing protein [Planifilum fulgidum]MBO2496044.1 LysM peptidoglycan-binding domain-containing protein [Bacillota bacterium]MBO2533607.1 peptidoglycan-binding protein [Thermoactinomycetaceae bacterium]SFG30295.1 3D (Asp-Asp-Asp) domain-containing protein [Planifilum fulgidum]